MPAAEESEAFAGLGRRTFERSTEGDWAGPHSRRLGVLLDFLPSKPPGPVPRGCKAPGCQLTGNYGANPPLASTAARAT